ncbi:MAG: hypothetical protein M1837_006916 [Sclerophora amabilis]|nr:MAG: hypothetical protein M1837_006916 [Sclerophora amabilis]
MSIRNLLITMPLLFTRTLAMCECGYVMGDSGDYFTNTIANDFTVASDTMDPNDSANFSSAWTLSTQSISSSEVAPLSRTYDPVNVWIQDGTLRLRQVAYTEANAAAKDTVDCAAIVTKEQEIKYGSFRTTMRVDYDPESVETGFVSGWFFYKDDDNEIDIETLGVDDGDSTYHYTCQPSSGSDQQQPIPWTEYQEQRFDWSESKATFYQDHREVWQTDKEVPEVSGTMRLNIWANNNSFSGMPSSTNVTTYVKSLLLYYNTTSSNEGTDKIFNEACEAAGGKSNETVCTSPEFVPRSSQSIAETNRKESTAGSSARPRGEPPSLLTHGVLVGLLSVICWCFL